MIGSIPEILLERVGALVLHNNWLVTGDSGQWPALHWDFDPFWVPDYQFPGHKRDLELSGTAWKLSHTSVFTNTLVTTDTSVPYQIIVTLKVNPNCIDQSCPHQSCSVIMALTWSIIWSRFDNLHFQAHKRPGWSFCTYIMSPRPELIRPLLAKLHIRLC